MGAEINLRAHYFCNLWPQLCSITVFNRILHALIFITVLRYRNSAQHSQPQTFNLVSEIAFPALELAQASKDACIFCADANFL